MCLRVDQLKDVAGSPFGKANRLYRYLLVQKLSVEWGSTNTGWHIDVHYVNIFFAHTCNICGVAPANARSVCLWAFCERSPRAMVQIGDTKQVGKGGPVETGLTGLVTTAL